MPHNPEIRRNLWLEFSIHRLLGMPIVLGLVFLIAGSINENGAYYITAAAFYLFEGLVKYWGGYKAAASVIDEVNERTWDLQKLSALSPRNLTVGKLFGSTAYVWYGGAFAFVALVASETYNFPSNLIIPDAALMIMSGLIVQAAALLSSLTAIQSTGGTRKKLRIIVHLLFGVVIGGLVSPPLSLHSLRLQHDATFSVQPIYWYGQFFGASQFLIVVASIIIVWLITCIYWKMRAQMKMKTGPWLWAVFLVFWAWFLAGLLKIDPGNLTIETLFQKSEIFNGDLVELGFYRLMPTIAAAGLILLGLYFVLFQEPWTGVSYRRLLDAWRTHHYRKFFDVCPLWLVTYPVYVVAGLFVFSRHSTAPCALLLAAAALFAARDIALLHLFKFQPSNRRPRLSTFFYLVMLYVLIPALLAVLHINLGVSLFLPVSRDYLATMLSAGLQAVLVISAALWRWKRYWSAYA